MNVGARLHRTSCRSLSSLLACFGLTRLLFRSSPLALLGHLRQTLVVQLGLDVRLVVAGAEASVVCFSNRSKELVKVLDSVAECIQS